MLALTGLCTILALLSCILFRRMAVMPALALMPCLGALIAGFSPPEISAFVIDGLRSVVAAAGMFAFAIIYFGVVADAGMLDPIISKTIAMMGLSPVRITMGTVLLALIIHLDGSGAVTFIITAPALLPLYERLGMDKRILCCLLGTTVGSNLLPWIGAVIRCSAAMQTPVMDIFQPLIPVQIARVALLLLFAYWFGKKEERRLGLGSASRGESTCAAYRISISEEERALRRPKMFWPNIVLTLCVMASLISGMVDAVLAFIVGTSLALVMNYPAMDEQLRRIEAHAKPALMIASILMSAGVLVGIMKNSGMLNAMALASVSIMPESMGGHIPLMLGLFSVPLSFFFDPDSFYFGVMPVIAQVYEALGGDPLAVARAALLGVQTTGFSISVMSPTTFLLVSLARIDLAEHQKFTLPYVWSCSVVMTLTAALLGVIPW